MGSALHVWWRGSQKGLLKVRGHLVAYIGAVMGPESEKKAKVFAYTRRVKMSPISQLSEQNLHILFQQWEIPAKGHHCQPMPNSFERSKAHFLCLLKSDLKCPFTRLLIMESFPVLPTQCESPFKGELPPRAI